ncbi:glycosyltransferase [Candidatus Sumerlaeota bacterium]|nr:glycosyltransferase [Candidatus Sumerlaeota bacterium]
MTKIFAIGTGPLLEKGVKKIGGQCLRTWHLVSPLLEDGHHVSLVTLPIPDRENPPEKLRESSEKRKFEGFPYTAVLKEDPSFLLPFLAREIKNVKPDCILGINTHPSAIAARAAGQIPFWADLNGWAMVEGQTRAFLDKDDSFLSLFWKDELDAVRRADHFSTVTQNQKYALIGELAVCGRLNQHTFDYPFADMIENAVNLMFMEPPPSDASPQLRGARIPKDAFAILWSGGFNTWTDIDLLYSALISAMEKNERIHFVSTGGSIDGHDEKTYARFHRLVAASPLRKRFVLLGWVEAELLPVIYSECDIGINVDAINYETLFGARNRVTNMLAAGLPVVTTLGTEISKTIKKETLGIAVPLDDSGALSAALCKMAEDEEESRRMGEAAREYALSHYSYKATTDSLRDWIKAPSLSPDNLKKVEGAPDETDLLKTWNSGVEKKFALLQDADLDALAKAERDLASIRGKPLFKLYKKLRLPF